MTTVVQNDLFGYKVLDRLGQGSYGEVFKVTRDRQTYYAMKIIKTPLIDTEEQGLPHDGVKEISTFVRLRPHPSIVQLISVAYDEKTATFALVMELATSSLYTFLYKTFESGDDEKRLQKAASEVPMRIQFAFDIGCGLLHLHRSGFAHLDLKPGNILVFDNPDGGGWQAKIADLGAAMRITSSSTRIQQSVTTMWYRAPEIHCGSTDYGTQADVWSLGMLLFELFFSFPPMHEAQDERNYWSTLQTVRGTPTLKWKFRYGGDVLSCPLPDDPKPIRQVQDLLKEDQVKFFTSYYGKSILGHILDLIGHCWAFDPDERITAEQVLQHALFQDAKSRVDITCQVIVPYSPPPRRAELTLLTQRFQGIKRLHPYLPLASEIYHRYMKHRGEPLDLPEKATTRVFQLAEPGQIASVTLAMKILQDPYRYVAVDRIFRDLEKVKRLPASLGASLDERRREIMAAELRVSKTIYWNYDGPTELEPDALKSEAHMFEFKKTRALPAREEKKEEEAKKEAESRVFTLPQTPTVQERAKETEKRMEPRAPSAGIATSFVQQQSTANGNALKRAIATMQPLVWKWSWTIEANTTTARPHICALEWRPDETLVLYQLHGTNPETNESRQHLQLLHAALQRAVDAVLATRGRVECLGWCATLSE